MKILHINTGQTGGASFCARRICEAQKSIGVETRMLVQAGESHDDVTVAEKDRNFWYSNPILAKLKHLLNRTGLIVDNDVMWTKKEDALKNVDEFVYINVPFSDYTNIVNHPLVEWADIIHLHWVACFVDYPTFFKKIKKPIVWTLHDKYPAMGIMHFCSEFYPVPEPLKALDAECRKIKRKALSKNDNIHIVAISSLMKEICLKSDILAKFPCTIIHNGVDTNIFRNYDKTTVRKELGLPFDKKILLFSSYNLFEKNKGLDRLVKALNMLGTINRNIHLICIGGVPEDMTIIDLPFSTTFTGRISGQQLLAKYYSCADVFTQVSYEETFSQTVLEAMACGTPVLSTPCSGASDVITDFNGVITGGYEPNDIMQGIELINNTIYYSDIIRNYILENFDYSIIAKQYVNLYKSCLKS